ncbi:MAG: CopG family transcriptional regulator [Thaumarchaeota archaeon]|nr:CopG family transcriptional regulator [Nitrososphaerota archaeon]
MCERMQDERMPVYISRYLYETIRKRVEVNRNEFKSVDEYVAFVLKEVTKEDEPATGYTSEEEDEIKKRLSNLGYL